MLYHPILDIAQTEIHFRAETFLSVGPHALPVVITATVPAAMY